MSRPLNVLYLIRTWALGGSHTIIRLFLKHLPQDEFNIITVPYDAPGTGDADFIRSVESQGNRVAPERIPWRSRGNWMRARRMISHLVEKYDIDLIHAHDTHSIVLVGVGRSRFPVATVGSPYGWWEDRWHLQARAYHWVEKNVALPQFERVYTVSQDMKRKVLQGRTLEDRIRVIHTGIDLAQFDGGADRQSARAGFGFDDSHIVVGTVSRLFREKGHTHLIAAAERLKAQVPQLRILIVGTGDQREALEAQARQAGLQERVVFTGYHADLPGALRAMDIFAQPSIDHEGFPTAVLEAQGAGVPVIASDIGGTSETLNLGHTGLLTPPADPVALATAILTLANDDNRRAAMAAAGRPWIESQFTLPNMIRQMSETYHEAMAEYRRPG